MAKKNEVNQILKELNETEFMKQPYLYAMIGADFTLMQRGIMIEIIHTLQDRFNAYLRGRKKPDGQLTLDLFTEQEKTNRIKTFTIEAASIGVRPDAYEELEQACKEMGMSMTTAFTIFAVKVGNEKRIPFEIVADPFYSEANMKYLRKVVSDIESGKARLTEHELIEE